MNLKDIALKIFDCTEDETKSEPILIIKAHEPICKLLEKYEADLKPIADELDQLAEKINELKKSADAIKKNTWQVIRDYLSINDLGDDKLNDHLKIEDGVLFRILPVK